MWPLVEMGLGCCEPWLMFASGDRSRINWLMWALGVTSAAVAFADFSSVFAY